MTKNKQMSSAQAELDKAIDGLCADFGKAAGMSAASYRSLLQDNVFALSYREKDRSGAWVTKTQPIEDGGLLCLLQMAKRFNLDPLNREIYPYFNQDGSVTPTLTIDGWLRLVNSNPDFDGCRITESEEEILIPGTSKPCAKWCQVELYRKSLKYPVIIREYFEEVFHGIVKRSNSTSGSRSRSEEAVYASTPWVMYPRRMLRHRAFIQAARYAFPCSGIAVVEADGELVDADTFGPERVREKPLQQMPEVRKAEAPVAESQPEPKAAKAPDSTVVQTCQAQEPNDPGDRPALCEIHNLKDKDEFQGYLLSTFEKALAKGRTPEATGRWICQTWQGDDQSYALTVWQKFRSDLTTAAKAS